MEKKDVEITVTISREAYENLERMARIKKMTKSRLLSSLLRRIKLLPVYGEGQNMHKEGPIGYIFSFLQ